MDMIYKNHHNYQKQKECPLCGKEYDIYWKIINHIRKTKDELHQFFLEEEEKELIKEYLKGKENLHNRLFQKNNIFCGISYEKIMRVVSSHLSSEKLEKIRRKRISVTLGGVPKTKEHNKKVSEAVKKAWKEGKFDTKEYLEARQRGHDRGPSMKGKNNPMYGKSSPRGAGRGKGGIREDIGHYVRSTWEANICRICQLVNRKYLFEPCRFEIIVEGNNYTYLPDLYFPKKDFYYEIKGHAKSASNWICTCNTCIKNRKKMKETIKKYKIKIVIIGNYEYKKLRNRFKKYIKNWEK